MPVWTEVVSVNSTLAVIHRGMPSIDASGINLRDEDAKRIAAALANNSSVLRLSLSDNQIGDEGSVALAKALETNQSLQELRLYNNQIGKEGGVVLAKALETNQTLKYLDLGFNKIGDKGGMALAKALETNQALQELRLRYNKIGDEGGVALAKALETNQTLTSLYLRSNEIGAEGGLALAKALETNEALQSLKNVLIIDFNNIPDNIKSDIEAKFAHIKADPKPQPRKNNRKELEQHYRAAVQNGDLQEWGRSKVMVIGQGEAGKTSSVQSLLGMPPAPTESTVGMDLKVTRASDWQERPAEESDFDFVAARAAARRAAPPKAEPKRRSSAAAKIVGKVRKSLRRRPSKSKPVQEQDAEGDTDPKHRERIAVLEEQEVARRFDFELVQQLVAQTAAGTEVSFSIWDYGGQEVFYALHHIFLSRDGLYLLVFDMEQLLSDQAEAARYLRFWLGSVQLHAPGAPVILVGTHADKVSDTQKVNRVVRKLLRVNKATSMVVRNGSLEFFPVDNKSSSPTRAAALREVVLQTAGKQSYVQERVPLAWLRVHDRLLADWSDANFVPLPEVEALGAEYGLSASDTSRMLDFLHRMGVLVHLTSTAVLRERVVTKPQWLVDQLSRVICDEKHLEQLKVYERAQEAAVLDDLHLLQDEAVASRDLLEFFWAGEDVKFLIAFMKETMLMCPWEFGGEDASSKFLVSSLLADQDAAGISTAEYDQGLTCVLDFSSQFLPNGVFQRLVSLCAEFSADVAAAQKIPKERLLVPELSGSKAVLAFGYDSFLIESRPDQNQVRMQIHPRALTPSSVLKDLVSITRKLRDEVFTNLEFAVLLERDGLQASFDDVASAREAGAATLQMFDKRSAGPTAMFDPFFVEDVGSLTQDGDVPNPRRASLLPLPHGIKFHVFLSHRQSTGQGKALFLKELLTKRGLDVWIDQSVDGNLGEGEMKQGIDESKCYLLLLTKDVFAGGVKMELKHALDRGKPILLVHDSEPGQMSFAPFSDFIDTAPNQARHLFKETESLPYRTRSHEVSGFVTELIRRIDQS